MAAAAEQQRLMPSIRQRRDRPPTRHKLAARLLAAATNRCGSYGPPAARSTFLAAIILHAAEVDQPNRTDAHSPVWLLANRYRSISPGLISGTLL